MSSDSCKRETFLINQSSLGVCCMHAIDALTWKCWLVIVPTIFALWTSQVEMGGDDRPRFGRRGVGLALETPSLSSSSSSREEAPLP